MPNNLKVGTIGQYKGPFTSSDSIILNSETPIEIGVSIGEKDAMKQLANNDVWGWTDAPLIINIDGEDKQIPIAIGQRFIYNPEIGIFHHTISFPNGAPSSTIIDYMILE